MAQRRKTGLSRAGAFARAWGMITDVNPFPSVLGRICPHPCEQHCNRSGYDEPLAINAMERFLGDWAIEQGLPLNRIDPNTGKEWVGVIGAGPSGLSFAYQMARRGYRVTIYEARERAGGMLRYGVPDFRLPQHVLDAEIGRILDLGVELQLNSSVGRDLSLPALRERHAALYLGLGAQKARKLGIPGEDGPAVWTGTAYLARVNRGEDISLGSRVGVIGGGNTAIDAARTASRCGADVTVLYRRSRAEMPALDKDIEDGLEEGIRLQLQVAPVRMLRAKDGALSGLEACRMDLGAPDATGRRRPMQIPGSKFRMPLDSVIVAVSQSPVLAGFEALDHDGNWLSAGPDGHVEEAIMAGGDVLGPGIAGNAIVQGRMAAERLHAQLRREPRLAKANDGAPPIGPERIDFEQKPRSKAIAPAKPGNARRFSGNSAEVTVTVSEPQFLREVDRCYSCGSCMGCEQCSMFCTAGCFMRLEEPGPGMYFTQTLDACEECGKCIEVCPCGFLDAS